MKFFSRKLIAVHLITVLVIVICGLFAQWQWNRAHFIRVNETSDQPAAFEQLSIAKDYLPVASIGARTFAEGIWQPGSRFFLTKRPLDGRLLLDTPQNRNALAQQKLGNWVVDLLTLKDGTSVAVVRGWTVAQDIPKLSSSPVLVHGIVQPAEDAPGPKLAQTPESLTTNLILKQSVTDVRDGFIVQSDPVPQMQPVTPTRSAMTTNGIHWRNVVYTINWVFFGILAILMWWRIIHEDENEHDLRVST